MPLLRAVARPLLASIFLVQGYEDLRRPEQFAPQAEPVVRRLADRISVIPAKPEQAVRINGAVQVVAGSMLSAGRLPRVSALAIALTLVPTTLTEHRFWEASDKQERARQRTQFLKNAALLGGLLIAAADTAGQPSLAWRSRDAVRTARREAKLAARTARAAGQTGARAGRLAGRLPTGN